MLLRQILPGQGKPGAFWDLFWGGGVSTCIEDGLLMIEIRSSLSGGAYRRIQETIKAAQNDANVKAIYFDMDSPGGYVSECAETAAVIKASVKPTVTYVAGYSASAAYWLAAASGRIIAHPSAFIGSVGVVNFIPEIEDGVAVTATKSPNKVNLATDPEGIARERALLDLTYEQFVAALASFRNTTPELIEQNWGKGSVMPAAQALSAGMIDEIGDREKALTIAKAFTGAAATEAAAEEISEDADEISEGASMRAQGENETMKNWFASRKARAEMTPEEQKTAEEITPEWLKENKPDVYDAIYNAGKDAAGQEAEAAKAETERLTALADVSNLDEAAIVAQLRSGKMKAESFMQALLEARKTPSETELQRRAKAGITGDRVKIHYGGETGAPQAGDVQALAGDIVSHLKKTRKAGK